MLLFWLKFFWLRLFFLHLQQMESDEEGTVVVWLADLPNEMRIRDRHAQAALIDNRHVQRIYPNKIALDIDIIRKELLTSGFTGGPEIATDPSCVRALIHVRADGLHDELRTTSTHERMHRDFFARLSHGNSNLGFQYYMKVLDIILLPEPLILPKIREERSFFGQLPGEHICDLFEQICDANGNEHPLPEWCSRVSRHCLRTARPFALLTAKGIMKSLSVCNLGPSRDELIGAHSLVIGWPAERARRRFQLQDGEDEYIKRNERELAALKQYFDSTAPRFTQPSQESLQVHSRSNFLNTEMLNQTFGCVRDLVRCVDISGAVVPHDVLQKLHAHVASLQSYADGVIEFKGTRMTVQAVNNKYAVVTLIHSFCACGFLKNDDRFRDACGWMLRACLPKEIAEHMTRVLASKDGPKLRLPSGATLSRMRGRLDVAWMLTMRSILHTMMQDGGLVMYPMIDSSPQAGRDYEMMVLNIVAAKHLTSLHVDITKLEQRRLSRFH
jgi:hypothetical protein